MTNKKDRILNHLFEGHPFSYYFHGVQFAYSAFRLEEVANQGDDTWLKEFNKYDLKPGEGFKSVEQTYEMHIAENDRRCRNVAAYLYAHALELFFKALYIKSTGKKCDMHKVTLIFKSIENFFDSSLFNQLEINKLLRKLDQLLIWRGRYPAPLKKGKPDTIKQKKIDMATTDYGYTGDIVTALSNADVKQPLKLLKDFVLYVKTICENEILMSEQKET